VVKLEKLEIEIKGVLRDLKHIKLMIRKMRKKSLIKKELLRNIFIKDIIYLRKKIKIKVLKI
jgi:hypothetical protein